MYPAISTLDLMKIPISLPDKRTRAKIVAKVKESFTARREARRLLDEAKALVEDAILAGRETGRQSRHRLGQRACHTARGGA
jgi:hypothetical protein